MSTATFTRTPVKPRVCGCYVTPNIDHDTDAYRVICLCGMRSNWHATPAEAVDEWNRHPPIRIANRRWP